MPVFVDHDQRRGQIIKASMDVLAELGFAKFTLREVGKRLGGSVTLVTHYFPTRETLLDALLENVLADAREMQDELRRLDDAHQRLRATIEYFLPLTEENLRIETARVAIASGRNVEPRVRDHLDRLDPAMRELIRLAIADFMAPDQLESMVDFIRLWTAGVVLTAVEHPDVWTKERQMHALDYVFRLMDISTFVG